jgi:hypothetical protein
MVVFLILITTTKGNNMFEVLFFVVSAIVGIGIFEEVVVPAAGQVVDLAKPVVEQAIDFVKPAE